MNKIEQENLLDLAGKYQNICMNINQFSDILGMVGSPFTDAFEPVTKRSILQTGHYANLLQAKIWVIKRVAPGMICVSNENITDSKDNEM